LDPEVEVGTTVGTTLGTVTIAGLAVVVESTIAATLGTITIAGSDPEVEVGTTVSATLGTVTIAGSDPEVEVGTTVGATLGTVAIAGLDPEVAVGTTVDATLGTVTIAGSDPEVEVGTTVDATLGTVTIAGLAVVVESTIGATTGTLVIAGFDVSIAIDTDISATLGTVTIAGSDPEVEVGTTVSATLGTVTIAGFSSEVLANTEVSAALGTVVIAGLAATVEHPVVLPESLAAIAVNQPTGGGSDYPLVRTNAINALLADIYLAYVDDDYDYELPFQIRWMCGFGSNPVAPPFAPVHLFDMLIEDASGRVVFDSRLGDAPTHEFWSADRLIIQWQHGDNTLRAVRYQLQIADFDTYFEPIDAVLDNRVVQQVPLRVRSLRLDVGGAHQEDITLSGGFNTDLEILDATRVDGTRFETEIRLSASPGGGDGRFGPACGDETLRSIRSISAVPPDSHGNWNLDADGCFRLERPVSAVLNSGPPRELRLTDHTLQLFGDCGIRCECEDFMAVYEGIRRMRNRYADMIERTQVARDLFQSMVERFAARAACTQGAIVRASVAKIGSGRLSFSVGYTNNGQYNGCLQNVVVPISFQYLDTTGNMEPGSNPPVPLSAVTTYGGAPVLDTVTVVREGNFVVSHDGRTGQPAARHTYQLGGAWPHYYVVFGAVSVGHTASVFFRLDFPGATATDVVELIVDAYRDGNAEDDGGGIPIDGYTPGSGPTGAAAQLTQVAPAGPQKTVTAILGAP